MALQAIPRTQYYLAFLAGVIVVSSYGITAGRPVLQIGALRFPFAETLPFPYPLTTLLFQFLCMHVCISLGSSFNTSVKKPIDDIEGWEAGRFTSPSRPRNTVNSLNRAALLRILPLGIAAAAEAVSGNYVLYNAPFEVYLLSRALVLPLLLLLDRLFFAKVISGRLLFPSIALSIAVFVTAFTPILPHSKRTLLALIMASLLSALLPLQLQKYKRSVEQPSKGEYSVVGSTGIITTTTITETYSTWSLLYYTSLISTAVIIPAVLSSGEPGQILRNCYFLNESRFWQYMVAGAIFRLAFFTSTVLLIEKTSALGTAFFCVLVSVSQVTAYTFHNLGRLQLGALTVSFLSTIWFIVASTEFESPWDSLWQGKQSALRRKFYFFLVVIAAAVGYGTVSQVLYKQAVAVSSPPRDADGAVDYSAMSLTSMAHGTDSYLGHRPPTNSVIDLRLLMEQCGGISSSTTKDVFQCLQFLSTQQDSYIISSSQLPPVQLGNDENDTVSKSSSTELTDTHTDVCDGPVVPYHIWGGHSPTWRIELFIKAYLYTQNLHCSRLWIWVDGMHKGNTISEWFSDRRFRRFAPLIESGDIIIKEWTLPARIPLPARNSSDELDQRRYYATPGRKNSKGEALVADSVVQDAAGQEWLQLYEDENQISYYEKAMSDVARFAIVHMYGGIYLDSGAVLLRDIRPLLLSNAAFIEKPDPREPFGNSLIAVPANSSISSYMLRGGTRMGLFFHAAVLQRMFVQEGRDGNNYDNNGLVRLEDAIFDPIWAESHGLREGRCTVPCLSSYVSVFKAATARNEWESFEGEPLDVRSHNRTLENFYRGAFAYHIHGQKKTQYEIGSWIDVICSAHDRWFAGTQLNPYGETWEGSPIATYRQKD